MLALFKHRYQQNNSLINVLVFLVLDMSSGREWNVDFGLHIMMMYKAQQDRWIVVALFKVRDYIRSFRVLYIVLGSVLTILTTATFIVNTWCG